MSRYLEEVSRIISKSVHLYPVILRKTFAVVFFILLGEDFVGMSLNSEVILPSMIASFIGFLGSVFVTGYLMTAIEAVVHGRGGDKVTYLRYVMKHFLSLVGSCFVQILVVLLIGVFVGLCLFPFLMNVEGTNSLSFFVGAAVALAVGLPAYACVCLMPPLVLFQKLSIGQALKENYRIVKKQMLLICTVLMLNLFLMLMPTGVELMLAELFASGSFGLQEVFHIFIFTMTIPFLQTIFMHLYFRLREENGSL